MIRPLRTFPRCALAAATALLSLPIWAAGPVADEFVWQAPLEVPAGASMARVAVPASALMQLRARDLHDMRVFNAAGEAVTFAFARPPTPLAQLHDTRSYAAYPLMRAAPGVRPGKGAVQVRVGRQDAGDAVYVRIDGNDSRSASDAARMPSVLFDTRAEKQVIKALKVQAQLPANAPVRLTAAVSADLAQWTPVHLRGSLYRFEGDAGLANQTLELESPQSLEGRYLRLDWNDQQGVAISSATVVVASSATPIPRVTAELPAPSASNGALEWPIGFATPLAALQLLTTQPNTLVPVRVLGRNDPGQPWRQLGAAVVYRLGASGSESTSTAVALGGASVRWLRVEATHGMNLPQGQIQASVEFEPVHLIFLATGSPPFMLAAGRADTPPAHVAPGLLAAAVPGKLDDLPQAQVGTPQVRQPVRGPVESLLPAGPAGRSAALWGVLAVGVLVLGGVAWSLLRQLKKTP